MEKVSITKFESMIKENTVDIPVPDTDIVLKVNRRLGLDKMLAFVNNVVSICFNDDGDYMPQVHEFVFRVNVLNMYTNLTMPKDINRQYDLCYGTDAYDLVYEHISGEQIQDIRDAIDKSISYRIGQKKFEKINQSADIKNSILESIDTLFSGLKDVLDGLDQENLLTVLQDAVNPTESK